MATTLMVELVHPEEGRDLLYCKFLIRVSDDQLAVEEG